MFDIKDFHDVVLRNGPVPLNILENLVKNLIASKQKTAEKLEKTSCLKSGTVPTLQRNIIIFIASVYFAIFLALNG